eukprot:3932009-Rhodomonas_salina.4
MRAVVRRLRDVDGRSNVGDDRRAEQTGLEIVSYGTSGGRNRYLGRSGGSFLWNRCGVVRPILRSRCLRSAPAERAQHCATKSLQRSGNDIYPLRRRNVRGEVVQEG